MATVSNKSIYCLGKQFQQIVRYKSTTKKFYISLPGVMPGGENEVTGKTEKEALEAFDAAIKEYTESVAKVTKVIIYGYEVGAYITEPDESEPDGEKLLFNSADDCGFGKDYGQDGLSVELWVDVCERIDREFPTGRTLTTYKELEDSIPESLHSGNRSKWEWDKSEQIPWTKEAEQFFVDIAHGFETLILKLNSVFGETKELKKFIKAGTKLLPGPQEKT